ncbi:MAG: hypothetical protein KC621_08615, partial [Myxococcales bacterium]|nr:hypothetical protein [Myxococcales bacterium]
MDPDDLLQILEDHGAFELMDTLLGELDLSGIAGDLRERWRGNERFESVTLEQAFGWLPEAEGQLLADWVAERYLPELGDDEDDEDEEEYDEDEEEYDEDEDEYDEDDEFDEFDEEEYDEDEEIRLTPPPSSPERPGEVTAGMPRRELLAWANERGLGWLLAMSVSHVAWDPFYGGLSIADALCGRRPWMPNFHDPSKFLARVAAYVEDYAIDCARRRDREAALRQRFLVDPGGSLTPSWRRFRDAWLRAATSPQTAWAEHAQPPELDPPRIFALVRHRTVKVDLESTPPTVEDPRDRLAVLHLVLESLVVPGKLQEDLRRALGLARWERALTAFTGDLTTGTRAPGDRPMLVWEVSERGELTPCECKIAKTGRIQGRRVQVAPLTSRVDLDPVDARVVSLLAGSDGHAPLEVRLEALEALAGHPRVAVRDQNTLKAIPVRAGHLQMALRTTDRGIEAVFSAAGHDLDRDRLLSVLSKGRGSRIVLMRPTEVLVVRCSQDQRRLAALWAGRDVAFPPEALPTLLGLVPGLQARVPLSLDDTLRGRRVDGDVRPVLQVRMEGPSLVLTVRVRPLPDAPAQEPGAGPETLHVVRNGLPHWYARDLRAEPGRALAVVQELGVPETARQGDWLWAIDDQQLALDVVRLLDVERFRVEVDDSLPSVSDATTRHLALDVQSAGLDWFGVSGRLVVGKVSVPLEEVVAAARDGRSWVQLGKNRFLRLEAALLARARALDPGDGGPIRVGAVHAPLLEAIEQDGGTVQGNAGWREAARRLRDAREAAVPVPDDLLAELRPYQRDGLVWLGRQAEWAPGAVLADDMGLGKTVQAIAACELLRRIVQIRRVLVV